MIKNVTLSLTSTGYNYFAIKEINNISFLKYLHSNLEKITHNQLHDLHQCSHSDPYQPILHSYRNQPNQSHLIASVFPQRCSHLNHYATIIP